MSLESNIIINGYSLVLLAVIFFSHVQNSEKNTLQYRLFFWLLISDMLLLVSDTAGRFDGHPGTYYDFLNRFGNFSLYVFNVVLASLWLLYTHQDIFKNENKTKKLFRPIAVVNAVNIILLLLSLKYGFYYHIDSGNVYHRGPLFLVAVGVPFALIVISSVMVLANRSWLSRKHLISLVFFPSFPTAAIVFQTLFYGISLEPNSIVISILMCFVSIQNNQIYTDHLTGLNNRKRLDNYFNKKVSAVADGRPISAIMIDVDHFKSINDIYGHKSGDRVLQAVAGILKDALGGNYFAARYGGDEFCVILEDCDTQKLDEIVKRINDRVKQYNASGNLPYQIGLSMGYSVYDAANQKPSEFFEQIDELMYRNKRKNAV